jgi:hypothetical protein
MISGTYSNPPCTEEGYKKIITLAILVEFFVFSFFHETKIPTIGEETLKGLFSRFLIPTAHLFELM